MAEHGRLRIGELSRRVDVSPELLRAWESRYGLVRPERTAGGLRLYSDEDERRVREMKRQLDRGLAAAEAARLAKGVAHRLAASRRQLQRAFAEAGETSFRDELAKVRMQRARDLLERSDVPVRQIAVAVGYPQPAQFAKSFRRHHGYPPSEHRRRNGFAASR